MKFLIDGYNLMHAVGLASRAMPAAKFERARANLLDWLADGVNDRAEVRVVFDAQHAHARSAESTHRGVRVRFAFDQTADDLIEEIIALERKRKALAVVSNDSQVRESARRGGCTVFACEEFVDWVLAKHEHRPETPPAPENKPEPTPRDVNELLNVFSKPKRKR